MNQAMPDDSRDSHLLAALRHAPDRDVEPPAQLSAAILGEAQKALRERLRPARATGWHAAWEWLMQPAPMAALGSLAMATLIGLMWHTQEMREATQRLWPETAAMDPARPLAQEPSTAMESPAPTRAASNTRLILDPDRAQHSSVRNHKGSGSPVPPQGELGAHIGTPATDARDSVEASTAGTDRRRNRVASSDADTVAPSSPLPTREQIPAASQEAADRRTALTKAIPEVAPTGARTRAEVAPPAAAPSPSSALALSLSATPAEVASPLAAVDIAKAMAGDGTRVRWRLSNERQPGHEAAQREWWRALAESTQGRWQPVVGTSGGRGEPSAVTLLIDGTPRGTLSFEPQALLWRDANGAGWRAAIEPSQVREWRELMARW